MQTRKVGHLQKYQTLKQNKIKHAGQVPCETSDF